MFYVGIDVASQKHDCCVLNSLGDILTSFSFDNSIVGFSYLRDYLYNLDSPENIRIGLEATGIYGSNLLDFLWRNGFETCTFNPLIIKKRLCATTLRKTKTDKCDAKFIAETVMHEAFQPDTPVLYHISELKSLTRFRFQLIQKRSCIKVQIKSILHTLFPEFLSAFSDIFGSSALAVLSKYPSAQQLKNCRLSSLTKLLLSASRGRLGRLKAEELKNLADNSIGVFSDANQFALEMYLQQLSLFNSQIDKLDLKIKELMDMIDSPIMSVPGISYTLGASILSEIGDINRFSSPAKLLAFAGLEPSIYQSGKFMPESGKMVKRGSPFLRWALTQAAISVSRYSSTFSSYLQKKLSEQKHYNIAVSHTAKKLVRVLFSILSNHHTFIDIPLQFAS